jgi:hypothetical protein
MFIYLLKYNNLNYKVQINAKENICQEILNTLKSSHVNLTGNWCISVFDKTFDDYIVVDNYNELPDTGKLKIDMLADDLVSREKQTYNTQIEEILPDAQNKPGEISNSILENKEMDNDLYRKEKDNKIWPFPFPLKTKSMPSNLLKALEAKLPLSNRYERVLVQHLYETMVTFAM